MTKIHYLKHRNSDFLAGVDLETFILEGNSTTLTVSKVEYKENFKVNGRIKPKGIVMHFEEEYAKPLIVNTTNSKIIKDQTGIIDASKWVGLSLDFYFRLDVEMKVSKTEIVKGGIRIKKVHLNGIVAPLEDIPKRIEQCSNKAEVLSLWQELSEKQQLEFKGAIKAKNESL